MELSIIDFFTFMGKYPSFIVTVILTLAVIFVNGWTDAPNAIATVVSTRAMKASSAVKMAAVFNLLGVIVMTLFNAKVAMTIYNIADFGGNAKNALTALCAALTAIVLWAASAWKFGIPTSESHALIAGISGAAIALHGSISGINPHEWLKVIYGLIFSSVLGFVLGHITVRIENAVCRSMDKSKTDAFFSKAQIAGGAGMAFMHGAQDGQKFIGVFLLGLFLSQGHSEVAQTDIPLWLMVLCALTMGIGTSVGGYRIIKSVGMDMVRLEKYQGFAADLAAAVCLLISSLTGTPVSTTHTKTTAIMGVGSARSLKKVNWNVVKEMILTWILTFPGCGLLGYITAKIFMYIF